MSQERGPEFGHEQTAQIELPEETRAVILSEVNRLMETGAQKEFAEGKKDFMYASSLLAYLGNPTDPLANVAPQTQSATVAEEAPTVVQATAPAEQPETPRAADDARETEELGMFANAKNRIGKGLESLSPRRSRAARAVGALAASAGYAVGSGGGIAPENAGTAKADGDTPSKVDDQDRKAKEQDADSSPRENMMDKVRSTRTVPIAVEQLKSPGSDALKSNMRKAMRGGYGDKQLIHNNAGGNSQMNSLFTRFNPEEINSRDGAEAVAFGIGSSDAYAAANYNALMGNEVDERLPAGVSLKEARDTLVRQLAGEDAKIDNKSGQFMNHGQRGEDVFEAGVVNLHNQRVLVIQTESGKKLYYKVYENGCINILTPMQQPKAPQPTPSAPTPSQPTQPSRPENPQKPEKPERPERPEKPQKPAGKDHTKSPVTGDRNHPNEVLRPNIPTPPVAIQPDDAPAVDPYTPPETVTPPPGVGPTPEQPADDTPVSDEPANNDEVIGR
jgi:hypothetical protein